jgi:ribonuclease HI
MQTPPAKIEHETWIMYFDGSVMKDGAVVGLVFISPQGVRMEYMVRLHFPASNNAAEYEALINGLRIAVELGIKHLEIRGDSELVVGQVMKDKNCVDPKMAAYCQAVQDLDGKFHGLELHHVLRDYNKAVDVLANAASSCSPVPHGVFASDQHQPSIREEGEKPPEEPGPEVMAIDEPSELNLKDPNWCFPILEWLVEGKLPSDQTEARRITRRAKAFVIIDGKLYKRGAAVILMRCIPGDQGRELLQEIHADTCGHHAGPRTLVGKAFRQGFYWSTSVADSKDIVRRFEGCQFYARQTHLPAQALQTIPITCPFAVWNLDMLGSLRQAPEGFTHLLVAVDKFSKWIEARPIVNIRSEEAVLFFTDIIYCFNIPNTIITDNGTQFTRKKFLNFCDDNHICVDWSAVAHPKTNRQVERANGMILQGLKPRIFKQLDKFRARWVVELPSVLWSLRTTRSRATGFTPFFMVHGSEAVLPTDIDYGNPRVWAYTEEGNQVALEDAIDQLDKASDAALLRKRQVPAGVIALPRVQHAPARVTRRRPRSSTGSSQQGPAQAVATLGGALHHPRGALTRDIQDQVRGQEGRHQRMEHQTPAPVLALIKCSELVRQ